MSLFKKPNKNIRRREIIDEDENDNEEVDIAAIKSRQRNGGHIKVPAIKQTLLSFADELDEENDGETFQIKKTTQSRRFRRQLDKEREERKKKNSLSRENVQQQQQQHQSKENQSEINSINTDNQVTIKLINPISSLSSNTSSPHSNILSGLSAEMARYNSESEEDEEEQQSAGIGKVHKFTQPDQVKMLLKSGRIPDAALIHAARKRRQEVRELGEVITVAGDYANKDTAEINAKASDSVVSRLARDDNDADDDDYEDDDRITMAGIVSSSADREKNKEGLDRCISSEESEEEEWESQQIRKAVSGAQIAAAQQEAFYLQQYTNRNVQSGAESMAVFNGPAAVVPLAPVVNSTFITPPPVLPPTNEACFAAPLMTTTQQPVVVNNIMNRFVCSSSDQIFNNLKNRLNQTLEIFNKRDTERKSLNEDLLALYDEQEKRKQLIPELSERFRFYQGIRSYVRNLVECFDEKVPVIDSLEQRLSNMCQKRANELINRRRQDVKDQVEDLGSAVKPGVVRVKTTDEERVRRAAEREGRRIRRCKKRDLSEAHIDGMSTDDEITEMTAVTYRNQTEIIAADSKRVFADVVDDFATVDAILSNFSKWRKLDRTAYVEAYANLCLPKLLDPLIRVNMLMWNPLNKEDELNIENFSWVRSVTMYAAESGETIESLSSDPDLRLLPKLIEKIIIPKLERIVKVQWNPLSSSETKRLRHFIQLLMKYPGIGSKSKSYTQLINVIIEKLRDSVDNDVFIPFFSKQPGCDNSRYQTFFNRQFAVTVKLLANVLNWQDMINRSILIDVAITSILNRYLLMAIRILPPVEAASKCLLVAQNLPPDWLETRSNFPSQLSQFLTYTRSILPQLDLNNLTSRDVFNKIISLTKNL